MFLCHYDMTGSQRDKAIKCFVDLIQIKVNNDAAFTSYGTIYGNSKIMANRILKWLMEKYLS